MRGLGALLLLAMMLGVAPTQAATHALVMGFDAYRYKMSLEGSRNDAADLVAVLRRRGVDDIVLINDAAATRATFEAAWAAMTARAAPGDLLFVSFSGHGNRSPERGEPKHTPDGFDKGFLLPSYDEDKAPEEQLRDEHLYDLFKVASDKGVKILFVADACHAGATVRAVGAVPVALRFQRFETHGHPLPPPPAPAAVVRRPPIPNLTVFSAADESQTIQEFTLNEQRRGALSYVVARGLDGAAAGPDGRLRTGDLARYVLTNVRLQSENTQIPSAVTPDPDQPLFDATRAGGGTPDLPPLGTVPLFASTGAPALTGASSASNRDATLSWIAGRVLDAHGDVVASGIGANALQGAIDARRVLDALARAMGQSGTALDTEVAALDQAASDRYYVNGESISIRAARTARPFLTVVDLSADGTVQFLWPRRGDPLAWTGADAPSFPVRVQTPFGQDTLIFIESDKALTDLHAALARLDGQVAPVPFYEALQLWLPQVSHQLGIHSVFTCAGLRSDGTCV